MHTFQFPKKFMRKNNEKHKKCPLIPKYARLLPGILFYHLFNIRLQNNITI